MVCLWAEVSNCDYLTLCNGNGTERANGSEIDCTYRVEDQQLGEQVHSSVGDYGREGVELVQGWWLRLSEKVLDGSGRRDVAYVYKCRCPQQIRNHFQLTRGEGEER